MNLNTDGHTHATLLLLLWLLQDKETLSHTQTIVKDILSDVKVNENKY